MDRDYLEYRVKMLALVLNSPGSGDLTGDSASNAPRLSISSWRLQTGRPDPTHSKEGSTSHSKWTKQSSYSNPMFGQKALTYCLTPHISNLVQLVYLEFNLPWWADTISF